MLLALLSLLFPRLDRSVDRLRSLRFEVPATATGTSVSLLIVIFGMMSPTVEPPLIMPRISISSDCPAI
ncbi:hypothetical protein DERP_009142 [Dermatophagoides pteronyssinus]|uniref:Uncharacterized protein n=1 Tax=Dermatophagoides pteronyssinus TaxID=6956 RepID=A0ABQ8JR56_DERPT|nr:hypothetical protein DERP_009142 [Dermatophagoides pteronyssinus]